MNELQVRQQETRLANTNEAKVLLPILTEYANLYRGEIKDEATKKKNILVLANELSKIRINNRPAIEAASASSIREVALKVITEDIDLSKKQAVLIPYGNDITLQKQFYGNVALAKQVFGNNIEFYSQLVYPGDTFEIIKNGNGFGRDKYEHTTSPKNMVVVKDNYKQSATPTFVYTYVVDLTTDKVIATNCFSYERCYNSWTQAGIKPTHKKFPGEMMIKTSESYLATRLYNKSNTDNETQLHDEYEEANNNDDTTILVDDFDTTPTPKVETPKKTVKRVEKAKPQVVEPEPVVETIVEPITNDVDLETTDFDIEQYVEENNQQAYQQNAENAINSFLDDDDFTPMPEEEEQQKPKRLHVKYRDFIETYQKQGYKAVKGTWNAEDKTCDIELND